MRKAFIECLVGTLGGFKSYTAVRDYIIPFLADGATVFTNIQVFFEPIKEYVAQEYGVEIEPDQLVFLASSELDLEGFDPGPCRKFITKEGIKGFGKVIERGQDDAPNLLCWDEIHMDYDSSEHRTVTEEKKELRQFVTNARKLDVHTIFITQHEDDVDVKIRRRTTFFIGCKDGSEVKVPVFGYLFKGQYCTVRWDPNRKDGGGKESKWRSIDKRIFKLYRSKALHTAVHYGRSGGRNLKKVTRKKRNMKRFVMIIVGIVVFLVSGVIWLGNRVVAGLAPDTSKVAQLTQPSIGTGDLAKLAEKEPEPLYWVSMGRFNDEVTVTLSDGRVLTGDSRELDGVDFRHGIVVVDGQRLAKMPVIALEEGV